MRGVLGVNDLDLASNAVVLRNEDAMVDATVEVYMDLGGGRCWLMITEGCWRGARASA